MGYYNDFPNLLMSSPPPIYAFLGAYQYATTGVTHNYSVPDYGSIPESPNRLVIVYAYGRQNGVTLSSATINGVTATEISGYTNGTFGRHVCIAAIVPSGTSSFTVSLTWSGSTQGGGMSAYCLGNLLSTTAQQIATPVNTGSITLTPPGGTSIVLAYHSNRGGSGDIVFGGTLGVVEDGESLAFTDYRIASASKKNTNNTSSSTITAATSSPLNTVTMAAVFR